MERESFPDPRRGFSLNYEVEVEYEKGIYLARFLLIRGREFVHRDARLDLEEMGIRVIDISRPDHLGVQLPLAWAYRKHRTGPGVVEDHSGYPVIYDLVGKFGPYLIIPLQ